jgi:xanthine dehydrogenase accessory factor
VTQATAPLAGAVDRARQPWVSATVVQVERPTSARPGDSAVVHADGRIVGFVGGVCAEATVRMHALQAMATGEPVLLRVVPGEGETPPDSDGMVTVHNPCLSGGALQIFLEPHLPPRRITVYGSSPVARALADLSRHVGYEVTESEDADAELADETTAVVVASLGRIDEPALLRAVGAGVPYIGFVASPKRGGAVLANLDLSAEDRARVHTPAGLDIGARTPHEIALSILAELISLHGSSAPAASRHQTPSDEAPAAVGEAQGARPGLSPAPTTAVDPICGMTVAAVDATLHSEHDGVVAWFCSEGCLRAFEQDPARRGGARERTTAST